MEVFGSMYQGKKFTLPHCWSILKDLAKWETSYGQWKQEGGKGKGNTADAAIDLDESPQCSTNPAKRSGRARRPQGHKAAKADLERNAGSLAFGDTLKDLMEKKEANQAQREERRRQEKEGNAKSFVDIALRSLEVEEAKVKAMEVEVEAKAMEAEAKAKLLEAEAEAKAKLLEAEAKAKAEKDAAEAKLLQASAMLMAEENCIMLTDLATISDPEQRAWFEKKQKAIRDRDA
jgi:colicin import membrane protein